MKEVRIILSQEAEEVYKKLNAEVEIIAFVLDIIDHPTYNDKFGYKGK